MISGVAFCPQPPVLLPALAGGAAAELDDLRARCTEALRAVAGPGRRLVLLGGSPSSCRYDAPVCGSLAGFGLAEIVRLGSAQGEPAVSLPASLTVGAWLVGEALGDRDDAVALGVGPDFAGSTAERSLHELVRQCDVALVVLGDGSARRSTAAPGYLDERAAGFDVAVAEALGSGDGGALTKLDAELAAELLAAGAASWHAAGALLAGHGYDARLLYDKAPYGVGYFVAAWTARA